MTATASHLGGELQDGSMGGSRSRMEARERVELVLSQLDALPTLSPVATRLLAISADDEVQLDEIVGLIEADPTLAGKILGLCRRAGLAMSERVTTVKHAAVMLGLEAVRAAVLSVAVYEALDAHGEEADDRAMAAVMRLGSASLAEAHFDRPGFWRYSIGVATACELLASKQKHRTIKPQEAFIAGLLSEIGKLMLDFAVPKGYARVLGYAAVHQLSAAEAAGKLIGIDHHQAGAHVAERWGLPEALVSVIRGEEAQQSGDLDQTRALMGLVRGGAWVCRTRHIGFSGEPLPRMSDEAMTRSLGIEPQVLHAVAAELHGSVSQRCEVLGLEAMATEAMLMESVARANLALGTIAQTLEKRSRTALAVSRSASRLERFIQRASEEGELADAIGESIASAAAGMPAVAVLIEQEAGEIDVQTSGDATWFAQVRHDAHTVSLTDLAARLEREGRGVLIAGPRAAIICQSRERLPGVSLRSAWCMAVASRVHQASGSDDRLRVDAEPGVEVKVGQEQLKIVRVTGGKLRGLAQMLGEQKPAIRSLAAKGEHPTLVAAVARASASLAALGKALEATAVERTPLAGTHCLREVIDAAIARAVSATGWEGSIDAEGVNPSYYLVIDRVLVEMAVSELILNAISACRRSAGDAKTSSAGEVLIAAQRAGKKGRWEIRVTDRGAGLSPGDHGSLFEPFARGQSEETGGPPGAGLGLTRARQWMRSHGGDATLKRTEDGRTRATLFLMELDAHASKKSEAA